MLFGLTNAPATFCTLMNKVFHPFLDKFVVVYTDDIVVYSNSLEEHLEHLQKVFQVLRENKLYVKKEKCSLVQEEVKFLGHRIWGGQLLMEEGKVRAIQEWEPPTKLAFDELKRALMEEPMLRLPDLNKPFEVHIDASDFAIGGVLMQDGHPLAFKSRKLNDTELRRFWLDDGILYATGKRIYVPRWDNLRRELLKKCHDAKWEGHPGTHRTLALMSEAYYWPQMREDVDSFMRTCLVCQQDKTLQKQPDGLLEPLLVPTRPWESLSMNFIMSLPKSEGCGLILVVVDRFTKYATLIPAPADYNAEEAARLFLKHVVKYWGIPKSIINDRDTRFTGKLWTELFKLLGSQLNFSTSFHPQTDGQTEQVNALLKLYLRYYVRANQRDWAKLLDVAQFSYNLQRSESTRSSPFELAIGQQPMTPNTVVSGYTGSSHDAYKMTKDWQLKPSQHKSTRRLHKALLRRYEGPFPIIRSVGRAAYHVELPPRLKIHLVFHVECIMAKREVRCKDVPRYFDYFVKWMGLPESEGNWEKEESLWKYKDIIEAFEGEGSTVTTRTSPD
ncbi:hypothetical protein L3X38_036615 [Prunus dulcis]|uniref:Transposable element protein n=1 Tax=Prunus dulcis TaxID=3755 RepID=A0AAD4V228_PRUDU|nr:hypothetical protein L3X38_036615 [Prunus dulcis]